VPGLLVRRWQWMLLTHPPLVLQMLAVEPQQQQCSQQELIPLIWLQSRLRSCRRVLKLEQVVHQVVGSQLLIQVVLRMMVVLQLEAGHLWLLGPQR